MPGSRITAGPSRMPPSSPCGPAATSRSRWLASPRSARDRSGSPTSTPPGAGPPSRERPLPVFLRLGLVSLVPSLQEGRPRSAGLRAVRGPEFRPGAVRRTRSGERTAAECRHSRRPARQVEALRRADGHPGRCPRPPVCQCVADLRRGGPQQLPRIARTSPSGPRGPRPGAGPRGRRSGRQPRPASRQGSSP